MAADDSRHPALTSSALSHVNGTSLQRAPVLFRLNGMTSITAT